jgi:hypothetical protein
MSRKPIRQPQGQHSKEKKKTPLGGIRMEEAEAWHERT